MIPSPSFLLGSWTLPSATTGALDPHSVSTETLEVWILTPPQLGPRAQSVSVDSLDIYSVAMRALDPTSFSAKDLEGGPGPSY